MKPERENERVRAPGIGLFRLPQERKAEAPPKGPDRTEKNQVAPCGVWL